MQLLSFSVWICIHASVIAGSSMPGDLCIACGSTRKKDPGASFHRFPVDERRRGVWLRVFQLQETQVKPHTRVCSMHFPGGDATKDPQVGLGKRFSSPTKKGTPRVGVLPFMSCPVTVTIALSHQLLYNPLITQMS